MSRPIDHAPRAARLLGSSLALVLIVAACGGPAATVEPTPSPTATAAIASLPAPTESAIATQAAAATDAPTIAPTEAPTIPPPTAPPVTAPPVTAPPPTAEPGIGVAIRIGDQQLMTVVAAEQWPGASNIKPAKGKAFFTVSIRIDALATTSWDSADFKLKDVAGKSYVWRTGRSPHLYDGANMTQSQNYVGWITYEIPKASLIGLTLIYKPAFLVGTTFKVPVS